MHEHDGASRLRCIADERDAQMHAARGRSERMFQTLQDRVPKELGLAGVTNYDDANRFLSTYIPRFSRRFCVEPAQSESAFTPLAGVDLELLMSISHERTVQNDNTVRFHNLVLQLESSTQRMHYVRCKVTVHELLDDRLAVCFQGQAIAWFDKLGERSRAA